MEEPVTDDMAAVMVEADTATFGADDGSCPAWCTEQVARGRPGSHVHRSDTREIPVTPHSWCQDMYWSGDDLRCTARDGITVFLTMTDDDRITEVVLQHGDMELPHFSLRAAEGLARHLSRLVQGAS